MMAENVAKDEYVVLGGVRFHYLDWGGNAPVLLCLHGAGGNARHWERLAETFRGELRVIGLDQRGHGVTDNPATGHMTTEMAEDVANFAEAIGLKKFNLLGHSMGARISLVFAGRYSHKLNRLILSDPPHYPVEDDIPHEFDHYQSRPAAFPSKEAALAYLRTNPPQGKSLSQDELEDLVKFQMTREADGSYRWRVNPTGLLEAMKFVLGDIELSLRGIMCPTLLLRGERSHLLSREYAQRMASIIRQCHLVEIKDAGHGTWRDNPEDFHKALREFLLAP